MLERVLIAGYGGQGIVLSGRLLATAAVTAGIANVTFIPAYGAEVRGGTSNGQVVLSSSKIASPVCDAFDTVMILNQQSLDRFTDHVTSTDLLIVNTSLCCADNLNAAVTVSATEQAETLGDVRAANFLMIGAYLARRKHIPVDALIQATRTLLSGKPQDLIDLNVRALRAGLDRVFVHLMPVCVAFLFGVPTPVTSYIGCQMASEGTCFSVIAVHVIHKRTCGPWTGGGGV